jgi:hypothetical protein
VPVALYVQGVETVNDCVFVGAAFQLPFPPWSALIVQVPAPTKVIVAPFVPLDVHTEVVAELKVTVRPDVAVAVAV